MSVTPLPVRKRLSPEESREAALEAARALLVEVGPQAVTLKAVAGRIGRTHANLLHHFGSAEGLQKALIARMASGIVGTIKAAVFRSREVQDPAEKDDEPYVAINDLDGLMGLVQSGVLEIHPWGSTLADWERPDRIIMDLDPGEGVEWQAVIDAAEETKERLEAAGLNAFVKTSGGKGLHVCAPLKPSASWPAIKAFCKGIADAMAKDSPDKYVATITKSKRRGKILIDYLRNQRGMTAVAPYSTRARPGAAVSMPLAWEELSAEIGPAYFTVENTPTRLHALAADPWADFQKAAKPLKAGKAKG